MSTCDVVVDIWHGVCVLPGQEKSQVENSTGESLLAPVIDLLAVHTDTLTLQATSSGGGVGTEDNCGLYFSAVNVM